MKICPACNNLNPEDVPTCARCGGSLDTVPGGGDGGGDDGEAQAFALGSTLGSGRYTLEALLGEGGMGSVYRARDERLSRAVALKVLGGGLLSHPTARKRMAREAEALARIEHPNVVQIRDVFDDGPYLVLVLELVTGGDLRARIDQGAMAEDQAIQLMDGVLSGLEALHGAGLVHRDIKPANILLTEAGLPKVTDLGIAHDSQSGGMTKTGAMLGTAHYMAPEQIKGGTVDARTDIYACGVVLYELLAGRPPFDGDSDWDVQAGHIQRAPDLSVLTDRASPHLVEAVGKCLAKEGQDRWASVADLRQALTDTTLRPTETTAGHEPPGERADLSREPVAPAAPSEPVSREREPWELQPPRKEEKKRPLDRGREPWELQPPRKEEKKKHLPPELRPERLGDLWFQKPEENLVGSVIRRPFHAAFILLILLVGARILGVCS